MTRRGGKGTSERRSGIGEDERQLVMARLAARWRRSNLIILVALRKGNHPGEAYVRRGRRKALYRRERDSLEGPHENAEIQRKALRRGKNLAFSEDTCLENKKSAVEGDPKKSWSGIETKMVVKQDEVGLEVSSVESTERKEASHFLRLRGRYQYSEHRSN